MGRTRIRNYIKPIGQFSIMLRAARNCFYYSRELDAYVRMCWGDCERESVIVEICPPEQIHAVNENENTGRRKISDSPKYIVWTDLGNDPISLLQPPLRTSDRYRRYLVDCEGKVVEY